MFVSNISKCLSLVQYLSGLWLLYLYNLLTIEIIRISTAAPKLFHCLHVFSTLQARGISDSSYEIDFRNQGRSSSLSLLRNELVVENRDLFSDVCDAIVSSMSQFLPASIVTIITAMLVLPPAILGTLVLLVSIFRIFTYNSANTSGIRILFYVSRKIILFSHKIESHLFSKLDSH